MNALAIDSSINNRLHAFAKAGSLLSQFLQTKNGAPTGIPAIWYEQIEADLVRAERINSWFTQDNLLFCLGQWAKLLQENALTDWITSYNFSNQSVKNIAVIAAGNVPLVGLHDVLCVLLTGNNVLIKASSNDTVLLKLVLDLAIAHDHNLTYAVIYVDGKMPDYDAVIATGSNNTARYFEYYFGNKPNIIRKNRNSIAVLTGHETHEELEALSDDVFRYFGLGCRSVSHLKVPKNYHFDAFFKGMFKQKELIFFEKYANNYDYNKAVYLMSRFELLDNEFLIIKEENSSYSSPIASLGYSFYEDINDLTTELKKNAESLQCVVAGNTLKSTIQEKLASLVAPDICDFGTTQQPSLTDYADGVDTVQFLLTLS